MVHLTSAEISRVSAFMHDVCGNDFSGKGHIISSKMGLLCMRLGYDRFSDLWHEANTHTIAGSQLLQKVIDALTTSYSYFYREDLHFEKVCKLIQAGKLPVGEAPHVWPLRAWSVGCASGEEPYNIAMALEDMRQAGYLPSGYQVVGSDISSTAIEAARLGRYDVTDYVRLPQAWRDNYCLRMGSDCEIKRAIRNTVEFRLENALEPRPTSPYDLVWCRNMIIYFDARSIRRLSEVFRMLVRPGGYLFLGHTEILDHLDGFSLVEPSIWQRDPSAPSLFPPHSG